MILTKHYKEKSKPIDYKERLSSYRTQATSFLKLQREGKLSPARKEKSTLESLLPLVAVSLTPFALQAQSCPNNPGAIVPGVCNLPEIQALDIDGDGAIDMEIHSTFGDVIDIGAIVRVASSSTWLSSGYIGMPPYFYFNAYAQGATINAANVNDPLQVYGDNNCGVPVSHYGILDYDPTGAGPSVGQWNGQTGTSPGLYMAFKKDGVLGFVELIYDDATNIVTIGNYGLACDASITSIIAGDCTSLAGQPIALTVTITEDANNDGVIDNAESSGAVDVSVGLPASAMVGDVLTIDDGINPPFTITLMAVDISNGTVSTSVPLPPNGTNLTVTGTLVSGCSTGTGNDAATINIPPPIANDICSTAISLPVDPGSCSGGTISQDNTAATDSGEGTPSCGNYVGGDQWYKLTVPSDGNVTVETTFVAGSFQDSAMSAYTGNCNGGLTEIACSDDEGTNFFSILSLTGLTPGSTLYIRVWEFGNDAFGTFSICAWSTCADYSAATGTPLTGTQSMSADYESNVQIDSDQIITSGNVDYDSALSIELHPGFEVVTDPNSANSPEFRAFIDGCGGAMLKEDDKVEQE